MRVLGIETSCDETALAVYDENLGLIAHALHSQTTIHAPYGGVVPELASRDHVSKILPLLTNTLEQAKLSLNSLDGIAYTAGPGLVGALLVGASTAKALGFALKIPTIAIHHMEGHLLAALLEEPRPAFPFIALLVSGGHTLLIEVAGIGHYKILGESLDDAAGEAFDKTAKLLGLTYPGGPLLAKLAESGNPKRFHFPRPLTTKPGLDFSFSGLKTFTQNTLESTSQTDVDKADIACAFQEALVDTLFIKCKRALQQTGLSRLVIAGGVGANQRLREKLSDLSLDKKLNQAGGCQIYYPRIEFCTDNGAMIAFAGFQRFKLARENKLTQENPQEKKDYARNLEISVKARWPMDTLNEKESNLLV